MRWSAAFLAIVMCAGAWAAERPNILWISTEDIGPHLGCYGDPNAYTPHLDALAEEGIRYTHAFTVAPVCAPNRSSIITGMYATTLGTQHMRSGGEGTERSVKPRLPEHIRCFSGFLREAGYYCTNNSKEDYNFVRREDAWDESSKNAHWQNRPDPDQPFFAVFNYQGTHEGSVNLSPEAHAKRTENLPDEERLNPDAITPPPYHPNTPIVRQNWADYLELISVFDQWVAARLAELDEAGVADNTIVIFWSDHGAGLPRNKRWPYDSGLHVPVIVYVPEALRGPGIDPPGTVSDRMIASIDFAPTTLSLAGLPVPDHMQGRAFLGPNAAEPRAYSYGFRDRMDERYDIIRTVRDQRYRYIRNYAPWLPYDQFMNSAEKSGVKQELLRLAEADELPASAQWVTKASKPVEELYDAKVDPHMVHDLADDPAHAETLARLRQAHQEWMIATRDTGLIPEAEMVRLEKRFGTRYDILPGLEREHPGFVEMLPLLATSAGMGMQSLLKTYGSALESEEVVARYWGAIGIANMQRPDLEAVFQNVLEDTSPIVAIVAARALCADYDAAERALPVLIDALQSDEEWIRLQAAIALDSIGEAARPALPQLQEALNDTDNKYVVRVANHAVNQLLGTDNEVR